MASAGRPCASSRHRPRGRAAPQHHGGGGLRTELGPVFPCAAYITLVAAATTSASAARPMIGIVAIAEAAFPWGPVDPVAAETPELDDVAQSPDDVAQSPVVADAPVDDADTGSVASQFTMIDPSKPTMAYRRWQSEAEPVVEVAV